MSPNQYSFIDCAAFLDVEAARKIDESRGSCVHEVVSSVHTYQMEYDPFNVLGRLPQCFVREFGDLIDAQVVLQDPNLNEIEVRVLKKCTEMYFDLGWLVLRDFYSLWFGGWVSFRYVNPKLLTICLTTRWGTSVRYPLHDPPYKYMLSTADNPSKIGSSCNPPISSNPVVLPRSFLRSYRKKLTSHDVDSGILVLPWYGFGEFAFAFTFYELMLVDRSGRLYPCKMQFSVDAEGELACKVFGCWAEFCKKHRLAEGDTIRFAINQPIQNYVMYVCVYPQLGIETTIDYPLNDDSYLPLYVSQHYFVAYS